MQPDPFEAVWDLLVAIVTEEAQADDVAWFAVDAEATGDAAGADDLRAIARTRRVSAMERRGQLGAVLAGGSGTTIDKASPGLAAAARQSSRSKRIDGLR